MTNWKPLKSWEVWRKGQQDDPPPYPVRARDVREACRIFLAFFPTPGYQWLLVRPLEPTARGTRPVYCRQVQGVPQ